MRTFWKSLLVLGVSVFLLSGAANTSAHSLNKEAETQTATASTQEQVGESTQFGPPSLLFGSRVQVQTEKPGSVFAVGSVVEVNAPIHGDLIVAAGSVQVSAPIFGDVYVIAGDTGISSVVHGGVAALTANFFQEPTSEVEGYGLLVAQRILLQGTFLQRVELWSQRVQIADSARFVSGITGTLAGDAAQHQLGNENAQNFSFFPQKSVPEVTSVERVSAFGKKLFTKWLQLFVVTLLCVWAVPALEAKKHGLLAVRSSWLSVYAQGVVVLGTLPILSLVLLPLPALWPLLFFNLALWSIALTSSSVPFVMALEQLFCQKVPSFVSAPSWMRVGTAAFFLALVAVIPAAGFLLFLLFAPLGVGQMLSLWKQR